MQEAVSTGKFSVHYMLQSWKVYMRGWYMERRQLETSEKAIINYKTRYSQKYETNLNVA